MLSLAAIADPALGIVINGYSSTRNDRFAAGYPGAPIANTASNFIGNGYDWSGIGWSSTSSGQSFALLGSRYFVYASHYAPGSSLQFASTDGTLKTYSVGTLSGSLGGDLAVGGLTTRIAQSDNVHSYSMLFLGYPASTYPNAYTGLNLLSYGWTARIGWNNIADAGQLLLAAEADPGYYLDYAFDATTPDRTQLVNGDSGSPSFIVNGAAGQMYLAGAHYAYYDNNSGGVDSILALGLPKISETMAKTGDLPSVVTPVTARWTGSSAGTSGGSWGTLVNWNSTSVPLDTLNGSGQVTTCASVLFDAGTLTQAGQRTVLLNGSRIVTSIAFNATAANNPFTLTGDSLTVGEAGLTNRDASMQTLDCSVTLRASQRWDAGPGGLTTTALGTIALSSNSLLLLMGAGNSVLNGVISGTNSGLAKDGSGTLTLAASNTYTGKTFIHAGTLSVGSIQNVGGGASALGAPATADAGTIELAATLRYTGAGHASNRVVDLADGPGGVGILDASGTGTLALSGGVTNASASGTNALVLQGSGSGSQSGAIANGAGTGVTALVKSGTGGWTLTGANSYTGTTTLNGGTLAVSGSSGRIAQSAGYVLNQGTLQLDNSAGNNNTRIGGADLTMSGGTLQLIGNGTSETAGTIRPSIGESTIALGGAGTNTLTATLGSRTAGAALNVTGGNASNKLVLTGQSAGLINQATYFGGSSYAWYDTSTAPGTVRGINYLSDSGAVAVASGTIATGSGHVQMAAAISGQPSAAINTLNISGGYNLGLAAGAVLSLSGGGLLKGGNNAAEISGGAGITTGGSTELVVRADQSSDTLTLSSPVLSSSTGGLTKTGSGTVVLKASNAYAGNTTVDAGTLKLGVADAIPNSSTLVIRDGAQFDLGGYNQAVAVVVLADATIRNTGTAAALSLAGNSGALGYAGLGGGGTISVDTLNLATGTSASAAHDFLVADGQGSNDLTVNSIIANGSSQAQSLRKTGGGTLLLGRANTYTGETQVLAGTLVLGAINAIAGASSVTVNGGVLNLGSYSDTVSSITLQNGAILGAGGVLSASTCNVQSGTVSAVLGGSATLSKTTAGTVVLNGVNTYSGGTSLTAGTLSVGANANLGDAAGSLVFNGGTLQITGTQFTTTARSLQWNSGGGGFDVADPNATFTLTAGQGFAGTGPLAKLGQGTLNLKGLFAGSGISVADGILKLSGTVAQLSAQPAVALSGTGTLTLTGHNESIGSLTMSGGTMATGPMVLGVAGNVTYNRSIWPAAISGYLDLGAAGGAFSVAAGSSTDLTVSAVVSGSPTSGLVKTGDGLLTLSGFNTYSGGTSLNAGTLSVGANANLGDAAGSLIFNGGTLRITGIQFTATARSLQWNSGGGSFDVADPNATFTLSAGQSLAGTGPLMKLGQGTLDLQGSFAGSGITVSSGTLAIHNNNGLGTGSVTLGGGTLRIDSSAFSSPRTFTLAGASTIEVARLTAYITGPIVGSYGLTKTGSGGLALSGSDSYSGDTTINQGTIKVGSANAVPSGTGKGNVVLNGGTTAGILDLSGWSSTINGLSGTSGTAVGRVINSNVTAATLSVGGGNATATFAGTIKNNNGSGGTVALNKVGTGTQTLSGSNSYSGGTTVTAGTLVISNANALPSGRSLNILGAGTVILSSNLSQAIALSSLSFGSLAGGSSASDAESPSMLLPGATGLSGADSTSVIPTGMASSPANSSQSGLNSVPEPGTLLLLSAAGLIWLGWLGWRCRRPLGM